MLLNKQRIVHSVVDHFLFRLPGLRSLLSAFHCTPGTVDGCVEELGKGHLLGLSPGGVYEAQFGDSNYQVSRFSHRLCVAKPFGFFSFHSKFNRKEDT